MSESRIIIITLSICFLIFGCSPKESEESMVKRELELKQSNDSLKIRLSKTLSRVDSLIKFDPIGIELGNSLGRVQYGINDFYKKLDLNEKEEENIDFINVKKEYVSHMNGLLSIAKEEGMTLEFNNYRKTITINNKSSSITRHQFLNDVYNLNIIVAEQLFENTLLKKEK